MKKIVIGIVVFCTCLCINITPAHGQSVKSVIKSVAGHLSSLNLTGTWDYEGVAVEFQSDNLLKKVGGKVAAASLENKIDNQLQHIGFQPGVTQFVFHEDSTFHNTTGGKKVNGKYTYNSRNNEITLLYVNHIPVKAKVSGTSNKISLLFEANSFLSLITFLGSNTGISAVNSIASILRSYDGMMVGMELNKISDSIE